ncbi:hypothetical protein NE573_24735, partial [Parabacteroides distasonis]|nr:hypothetical protein [Parabacteroides distasonis]
DEILGIKDLRSDKRIDFMGGIRGLGELKRRVDSGEMKVALALYPVTMKQLMDIADTGNMRTSKYSYFLLFAISLPLYICCEEVLSLWLGEVPAHT